MKKQIFLFLAFFLYVPFSYGQTDLVGIWKTIDDNTGEAKSYITISELNGTYTGKVSKLLLSDSGKLCDQCTGDKKNKPILGMIILEDIVAYKDYYSYGQIMDPETGKLYKCSIWQDNADQLTVRGYIGISALGRSQIWYRVKN